MFQMHGKRWIITIIIGIIFITIFRLAWLQTLTILDDKNPPSIHEGVLDLRDWEFSSYRTMPLDGVWNFYPQQLLTEVENREKQAITVPNNWKDSFPDSHETYGTYHLKILLDEKYDDQTFGLRMSQITGASAIYVNGSLVTETGIIATEKQDMQSKRGPTNAIMTPTDGVVDIMIQVAHPTRNAGITRAGRFGTDEAIQTRMYISIGLQLLTAVFFIIHSLYAMILYLLGTPNRGLLYFSLMMFFGLCSVLTTDDRILYTLFNVTNDWTIKITYLTYIGAVSFMPLLLKQLYPMYLHKRILQSFLSLSVLYAIFVIFAPSLLVLHYGRLLSVVMLVAAILSAYILWRAIRDQHRVVFLLLASTIIGVNIVWAIYNSNFTTEFMHYPFDLIFSLIAFASFWFQQFFETRKEAVNLSIRLQKEDKRKDEFLVQTSHELRNPLHGMINLTEAMLQDKQSSLSGEQKKRLELQKYISRHLTLLIEDLLDITRLKEKSVTLHWQVISLPSVSAGVIDMLRLSVHHKQVTIKNEIETNLPFLYGDEQRLVQILYNLIDNALKFTNTGSITLRASEENNMANIQVIDTGVGIHEDDLEDIFSPYTQVHEHMKEGTDGLGLGLNICKELVQLHGGEMSIQSTPNKGTTVSFTMPIAGNDMIKEESMTGSVEHSFTPPALHATSPQGEPLLLEEKGPNTRWGQASTGNVLLVEDDSVNLTIIQDLLETEEYKVYTAKDGEAAWNLLQDHRMDLIISDVMMPNMSGYELTRQIRKQYSLVELPILLLTARARPEDILTGFQVGANDYVTKPVDATELKARVRVLIKLKVALEEHVRMEGAWLQSQIQPHFLFNTLNAIASLGFSDPDRMQDLLMEFTNYLRLSFDFKNAKPLIPIESELELVRSYVFIEQTRFGERLHIEWKIDPDISIQIPPLSIQPLVENAINHGILKRIRPGTVTISIQRQEDFYEVSVQDDGVGMNKETLKELLENQLSNQPRKNTRVGLRNINRRLEQLFRTQLIFTSAENIGTTVSFKIPVHIAEGKPK